MNEPFSFNIMLLQIKSLFILFLFFSKYVKHLKNKIYVIIWIIVIIYDYKLKKLLLGLI